MQKHIGKSTNKKIICEVCKKEIIKGDKRVHYIEDVIGGEVFFEKNFHQKCWIEWYNESLDNKIKAYSNQILKVAMPKIKQAFEGEQVINL